MRAAAWSVGFRVALVAAGLVLSGGVLLAAGLWYLIHRHSPDPHEHHVLVALDPGDLAGAAALLGLVVVAVAWLTAVTAARRAVRPLAEALARQRAFVADAGHELRTPLAVLHARVQQLEALTPAGDAREPVVRELRRDSRELVDLVTDLLDSAEGVSRPDAAASVGAAVSALGSDLAPAARARGVVLRTEGGHAHVAMPTAALRRCLVALTDNALAHAPRGSTVRVLAEEGPGGSVLITVSDEGAGLTGITPERVFERFAHGDPGHEPDGSPRRAHGIGLALVRDITERYAGSVDVAATGPGGTTFRLILPRAGSGPAESGRTGSPGTAENPRSS